MGVTGDGSYQTLFGYAWAAALQADLRLYQAQGDWVEQSAPPLVHPASELRHLALAFDQAARHVVAYERNEEVWVRQWDALAAEYVMRGPWPGVDPVLIQDSTVGYYPPDSDVLLFHLSPDRTQLIMRVQRELYGVAHVIATYPNPQILDQAVALPYQIQLIGSNQATPNTTDIALISAYYPFRSAASLALSGEFAAGDFYQSVKTYQAAPFFLSLAGQMDSGDYVSVVQTYQPAPIVISLGGQMDSGNYPQVVQQYQPAAMTLALVSQMDSGNYPQVGIAYQPPMALTLAGEFSGGTYA